MMQLSRREFLLTALCPGGADGLARRSADPQSRSAYYRVASEQACRGAGAAREVHPFSTVSEGAAWEAPPAMRARTSYAGERPLKTGWDVLPATLFLGIAGQATALTTRKFMIAAGEKLQKLVIAGASRQRPLSRRNCEACCGLTCERLLLGAATPDLGAQKAGAGLPECE